MFKNIEKVIENIKKLGPEQGSPIIQQMVQSSAAFERCAYLLEKAGHDDESQKLYCEAADLMQVVCQVTKSGLEELEDPPRIITPKGPRVAR